MINLSVFHAEILHTIHTLSVDPPWSQKSFESLLRLPTVKGYATDDLSCFVLFSVILDEAEILTIATHPSSRRQGLAENLLTICLKALWQEGIKAIFLDVDVNNSAAIALYQKLGFNDYGIRKKYYQSANGFQTDAKLMKKIF